MKPMRLQFIQQQFMTYFNDEIDGSSWYDDGYGSRTLTTQFQSIQYQIIFYGLLMIQHKISWFLATKAHIFV